MLRDLWRRYVSWRKGDGASRVRHESPPVNKIAADEGDVTRERTANRGAGWSNGMG